MAYNPPVPLMYPIPGGVYSGRMIRLQATTPPGSERFIINLQCGPNFKNEDIALHMHFRFIQKCVVRNHLQSNKWGTEEINGGLPITKGECFELLVLCERDIFKVALNGVFFCEFRHRLPVQRITHLAAEGEVTVQLIGFDGEQPPPNRLELALAYPIPGGVYPGSVVYVRGSSLPVSERFVINLQSGPSPERSPYDDILFHMHFRFVQQCIVRNHRSADKWGQEESEGGIPLKQGESFELMILCEPRVFKVVINGKPFCEFAHRLPFYRITHLTVERDIRVEELSWKHEKTVDVKYNNPLNGPHC